MNGIAGREQDESKIYIGRGLRAQESDRTLQVSPRAIKIVTVLQYATEERVALAVCRIKAH